MALVNCPHCGGKVSDQAKKCPHCGADLTKKDVLHCPECGAEIPEGLTSCPNCGWPVPEHMLEKEENPVAAGKSEQLSPSPSSGKKFKRKTIGIIAGCAVCAAVAVGIFVGIGRTNSQTNNNVQTTKPSSQTNENALVSSSVAKTQTTDSVEGSKVRADSKSDNNSFTLKQAKDKYTVYMDNYVGKNVASVGYTSLDGNRRVRVGAANIVAEFVTEDGSYVGASDEDDLKNYVITSQSIAPNTEVHLTFKKKEDGTEYDNVTNFSSYDEIDFGVKRVGSAGNGPTVTPSKPSPDKYTYYIRNYVGKNLASVGYQSLGGEYRDHYGGGTIRLDLVTQDGSYIDTEDEGLLKQYVITGQSIEPGSEIKFTFKKDNNNEEYDSVTDSQSCDAITLNVKTINGKPAVPSASTSSSNQ